MARYGLVVPPSDYTPRRDWIEQPLPTGGGNVVLVVNHELDEDRGSAKVAHVVLTRAEVETLAGALLVSIGLAPVATEAVDPNGPDGYDPTLGGAVRA